MSLENGKCPNCGGVLLVNNSEEKAVCKYCGTELVIKNAIKKCVVDGIATFDALLLGAEEAIRYEDDYDKALKKYKEALNLKPGDYRVLWGIYLCEMSTNRWHYKQKGYIQFPGDTASVLNADLEKYGKRAIENAPEETKAYYIQKIEDLTSYFVTNNATTTKSGCYIATAIYGSYDCPSVWTLRRYRDICLSGSHSGRLFIKIYYAISPTLVKLFGATKWFNSFWKKIIDGKVKKLQKNGYKGAPYLGR